MSSKSDAPPRAPRSRVATSPKYGWKSRRFNELASRDYGHAMARTEPVSAAYCACWSILLNLQIATLNKVQTPNGQLRHQDRRTQRS
jgi:hypothetical protein